MFPSPHPKGTNRQSSVFIRSAFNGNNVLSELENSQHLFWNLIREIWVLFTDFFIMHFA